MRASTTWGASLLAGLLALLTLVYLQQARQTLAQILFIAAFGELLLTVMCAIGAELVRQRHSGWGTGLVSISVLGTLVLMAATFAGLGPALVLLTVVATPAIATQTLPVVQADRATRASLLAGLLVGLVTLFPPLPPLRLPLLQTVTPYLAGAAFLPYLVLLAREYRSYNLRAKLILAFVLVSLMPLGLLAALNNQFTRQSLTSAANQALTSAARQTASSLDDFFVNVRATLNVQALLPDWHDLLDLPPDERVNSPQAQVANEILQVLRGDDPRVVSYQVIDQAGVIVASSNPRDAGVSVRDEPYFRVALDERKSFISPVVFAENDTHGSFFVSAFIPKSATDVHPHGVLVVRYDAQLTLPEIINPQNNLAGADSFAVLFDENRVILAHGTQPDLRLRLVQGDIAIRPTFAELLSTGRLPATAAPETAELTLPDLQRGLILDQPNFTAENFSLDTRVMQAALARLESLPWQVAFFQPRDVFLEPAQEQTSRAIILAIVIAAVVAVIALGIAQLLSTPITRLTTVARKVTEGDLSSQASVETGDEIGALALAFNSMTGRLNEMISTLGERVAERTAQLKAVADIGRATTSIRDLNQLLPLALELVRERFGFYHASIFLLDAAGEFAVLRESTGEAGRQLKARAHKLAVGSRSLVGAATAGRRPVIVQDVTTDPTHFKNPLLPDTRAEAVIPLLSGDRLIGALDVQSTTPGAFTDEAVQILQTLADQLSVTIENAESFQRTQASLAEVSALYEQVTGQGLRALTSGQTRENIYDLIPGGDPLPLSVNPIRLPLNLRGQTVGEIELHGRSPETLSAEERAVLDAVAGQLGVALESAALLEETQRRTRREQLINQITYQMRATLNPDAILQSGIRELGRALGATEVVVKLAGSEPGRVTGPLPETGEQNV
jgi:GAF domain-containing protein/HAMP domain-containing protein